MSRSVLISCCFDNIIPFSVTLFAFLCSLALVNNFAAIFLYFFLTVIFFLCAYVRIVSGYDRRLCDGDFKFCSGLKIDCARTVVAAFVLEILTIFGRKGALSFSAFSPARVLLFFLLGNALLAVVKLFISEYGINIRFKLSKNGTAPIAVSVLCTVIFSVVVGRFGFSKTVLFASALPIAATICCIVCLGDWWNRPELFTFTSVLAIGLGIILVFPVTNLYSWDDQVHFENANNISFIDDAETTVSDRMLENLFEQDAGFSDNAALGKWPINPDSVWSRGDVERLCLELNQLDTASSLSTEQGISSTVSFLSLGYLPSSFGIWLGRLFHLPFSLKFVLGKLFNLIFYAGICYLAIKMAPCKKYLLSFIALLPSNVFMAANYSYDPWINCLTLLGMSLLLSLITGKTRLSYSSYVMTALIFVLAFAPKAVYFPVLGLLFVIPESRFRDNKQKRKCESILVALGILVVVSFVIPFIASNGGGSGDARGGSDVNSTQQVIFILSDPLRAFAIISKFVFTKFLNPCFVNSIATNIAYLGDIASIVPLFGFLPLALGVTISVLDGDDTSTSLISLKNVAWVSFLLIFTCYLISTALYISFTGVARASVAGVQARYLNPMLFAAAVFVFNMPWHSKHKYRSRLEAFSLLSSAAMLYSIMFILLFSRCFG